MNWGLLFLIGLGGFVGAITRYGTVQQLQLWTGNIFPFGTLFVNTVGSFLFGILWIKLGSNSHLPVELQKALTSGFLGAFTTFSTFSFESLQFLQQGEIAKAVLNLTSNVVICLLACWLGTQFSRF